jgi:hypothetical protein
MNRIQLPTAVGRTIVAAAISLAVNIGTAHAITFTENFNSGLLPGWSTTGNILGIGDRFVSLVGNQNLSFTFSLADPSLVDFSFWYGAFRPIGQTGDSFSLSLPSFSDSVGRTNVNNIQVLPFLILNPGPAAPNTLDTTYSTLSSIFLTAGPHTLTFQHLPGALTNTRFDDFTMNVTAVPEPGSWAMLLAGLGAMGLVGRRRRPQD